MMLPFRLLILSTVISVLVLQLSGCGESSNNLNDPATEQINTITKCDSKTDICTSGQFIDEPVSGLNYSCNQVTGITDSDGFFSCPNNSVVTFYLQAEKGKYKITLGSYLIKSIGNIIGSRQNTLLQITPKDITKSDSTGILQLLQLMDSDGYNNKTDVLNRIVITNNDKRFIDLLARDLSASEVTNTTILAKALEPIIAKLERPLPLPTDAISRFERSLKVLQSGVYEVSPFIVAVADKSNNKFYTGMVGQTPLSNEKAFEGLFFIIDRDEKLIGTGLEWRPTLDLTSTDDVLLQKVLFDTVPQQLQFSSQDVGFNTNGTIKANFKLIADDQSIIEITQGVMSKGNLLGNDFFYRNTYGMATTEAVTQTDLGKWKRTGTIDLTGSVTISKTRNISPFLDASIWTTKENSQTPVFPLHLKLTLKDKDLTTCAGTGCLVGDMGISILENGNIISDVNNNCRAVDADMKELFEQSSPADLLLTEHRLGVISTTLQDDTVGAAISPILLVDNWARNHAEWGKFFGFYMGMQSGLAGGPKVQINITNVRNKVVSIQNQKDEQEAGRGSTALWANYVKLLTAYSKVPATAQTLAINQAQGYVSAIEVQPCNSFLK